MKTAWNLRWVLLGAAIAVGGCSLDKDQVKGELDSSPPPAGDPAGSPAGKADEDAKVITVEVQSPHPYANDMDQQYRLDLDRDLPSCASRIRVHFAALATEADYDHLDLIGFVAEERQSFTGNHNDTWSQWFFVGATASQRYLDARLTTDGSVTRHGFEIDAVQWDGSPTCPAVVYPPCAAGSVDVSAPRGACECPVAPTCLPLGEVRVSHAIQRGFMNNGKVVEGTAAFTTAPGPTDAPVATRIGDVDATALTAVIRLAAQQGLTTSAGYASTGETNEHFRLELGGDTIAFSAPQGGHEAKVQIVIDAFLALFACGEPAGLTCAGDHSCVAGSCTTDSCVCPAIYEPVCGLNGRSYSNACAAGCEGADIAHPGECGITGDMCGGFMGRSCADGHKCRFDEGVYTYPYPDAGGLCVVDTFCDAAVDCAALAHVAVPGSWQCVANSCSWATGSPWQTVNTFEFETAHPYANDASDWKELALPTGAAAMRLVSHGSFELEAGYDYLEVWSWNGSAWRKVASFSGTAPPTGQEFPGRYHYLHLVSDYSITAHGFHLTAEYRN